MRYAADMDREEFLYHLAFAEQRAAEGLENIEKQRSLIRRLECDGQDVTKAKAFMDIMVDLQALHEQLRDTIKQELDGGA
jgi:hypothetical protein